MKYHIEIMSLVSTLDFIEYLTDRQKKILDEKKLTMIGGQSIFKNLVNSGKLFSTPSNFFQVPESHP